MKMVSPEQALDAVEDGGLLLFPGCCAEPQRFYDAFSAGVERFNDLTVASSLSFGDYSFLQRGLGQHFRYLTWQASPRIRHLFKENDRNKVGFVPIRLAEVCKIVNKDGPIKPTAVVVQTSLPQNDGTVSLGISVGPNKSFVDSAPLVIAELNVNMPVTAGDSRISLDDISLAYESDLPLLTYKTGKASARDAVIIEHVLSCVPERAHVQLGIGSVPDRVLSRLSEIQGTNLFSGLLTQGLMDFVEQCPHTPSVTNGELAGDQVFYDYCGRTSLIKMMPTSVTHDITAIAGLENFISINSCVEIDLQGQTNGESLGAVQISGVGGALDYVEAAALSTGGRSILALPSTTEDGKRSKIVTRLAEGAPVTTPRYCTDYVVTEYGIAQLKGKDLHARADALINIAHPDFRDQLANIRLRL